MRGLGIGLAAMLMALHPALASIYVGGDSLGVGVHLASKAPSVATESVRITSKAPVSQISEVPKGSTLFLSLGTNDAVGGVLKVQKSVDAILSAAADRNIRVIWLGPPCMNSEIIAVAFGAKCGAFGFRSKCLGSSSGRVGLASNRSRLRRYASATDPMPRVLS